MTAKPDVVRRAAEQILAYLANHPDAADTSDGVCAWWLPRTAGPIVEAALETLVTRGLVHRYDVAGGHPVYSRAHGA